MTLNKKCVELTVYCFHLARRCCYVMTPFKFWDTHMSSIFLFISFTTLIDHWIEYCPCNFGDSCNSIFFSYRYTRINFIQKLFNVMFVVTRIIFETIYNRFHLIRKFVVRQTINDWREMKKNDEIMWWKYYILIDFICRDAPGKIGHSAFSTNREKKPHLQNWMTEKRWRIQLSFNTNCRLEKYRVINKHCCQ